MTAMSSMSMGGGGGGKAQVLVQGVDAAGFVHSWGALEAMAILTYGVHYSRHLFFVWLGCCLSFTDIPSCDWLILQIMTHGKILRSIMGKQSRMS